MYDHKPADPSSVYVYCLECGAQTRKFYPWLEDGVEHREECIDAAIEAWNTRHERTCCKELMVYFHPATDFTTEREYEFFGCSWCGEYLSDTDCYGLYDAPNYCSNCGRKVDKSFVIDESTGEVIYRDGARVKEDTDAD